MVIPDHSSFSVLRETPMTSTFSIPFRKAKILQILGFTMQGQRKDSTPAAEDLPEKTRCS
jgi:hypothetical protein